jgi:immune inhibitor A
LEHGLKKNISVLSLILAAILVLCCCLVIILGGGFYSFTRLEKALPSLAVNPFGSTLTQTPTLFQITRQPAAQVPIETLKLLQGIIVSKDDPASLACRFRNVCNIPPTLPAPPVPYAMGERKTFWALSEDTNSYFQVQATLRYVTPHSYFWISDSLSYNQQDVKNLMQAFENKIYPTDRQFFGSEWTPGVDDDPHIYILYTNGLGAAVGGAYSSVNEYPTQVNPYSNAHEMFYISSSEPLTDPHTYGDMAHEFQHMIHWYEDPNEPTFLNEGFSKLAEFLNGYPSGSVDQVFINDPNINLTDWLIGSTGQDIAHYGASFLFATYFLDRFGVDTTKALIHNQHNGLEKIDNTLAQLNITDPLSGKVITADDFFLDWTIANYVHDISVSNGRYFYHNYPNSPQAGPTETIRNCPANPASRTVNQYGANYILITCPGIHTLHFDGATSTRLLPSDPHSGSYAYWSNLGDQSDMTLTHQFDLSSVSGPVSMSYWTWYDIEKDYDYVYVEASTDDQHWNFLTTPSGTGSNPNGASYGWAYTGQSNGWIQESVDLSRFAGKKVSVRFEYLTDQSLNGAGFLLDDVSIPAIHYSTSFETDDGSWLADGFARILNTIPQTFRLALISHRATKSSVRILPMAADQSIDVPLTIGENGVQDVVLVVTGTTRFTKELAPYQFSIR